jgi:hypothetical protein
VKDKLEGICKGASIALLRLLSQHSLERIRKSSVTGVGLGADISTYDLKKKKKGCYPLDLLDYVV